MGPMLFAAFAAILAMGISPAQAQASAQTEVEHGFAPSLAAISIADVQRQLTARGYYAGPINGQMSPAVRTAVSVYQSDVSMRVTGIPDLAVLNMLKFGPEVKATIQPLGAEMPPASVTPAPVTPASGPKARTAGVPPYETPEPYRYPAPDPLLDADEPVADPPRREPPQRPTKPRRGLERTTAKAEEPPLPKAAPQHKVESSPLPPTD